MVSVCVLISPFVLLNSSHPKKICWEANKKCADCPERGPTYVCHVLRAQKGICPKMVQHLSWVSVGKTWERIVLPRFGFPNLCVPILCRHSPRARKAQESCGYRQVDPWTINFIEVWTQDQKHLLLWMECCRGVVWHMTWTNKMPSGKPPAG